MGSLIFLLLIVMRVIFVVLNIKPPSMEFWAHYRHEESNTSLLLKQGPFNQNYKVRWNSWKIYNGKLQVKQIKKLKLGCCSQINPTGKGPGHTKDKRGRGEVNYDKTETSGGRSARGYRQVLKPRDKLCWVASSFHDLPARCPIHLVPQMYIFRAVTHP